MIRSARHNKKDCIFFWNKGYLRTQDFTHDGAEVGLISLLTARQLVTKPKITIVRAGV